MGESLGNRVVLVAVAAVVGVCGVLGVSYVVGQGWRLFDGPVLVLLCVAATALAAIALWGIDRAFGILDVKPRDIATNVSRETLSPENDRASGAPSASSASATASVSASPTLSAASAPSPAPDTQRETLLARITPRWSPKSIAVFSLVMALFWLPWLVANFPGGTYWDTYYQIFQCYPENHPIAIIPYAECYDNTLTDAYLCDHHPIFDTLVYGAFGMASDALTGDWMAGVFAFVCLQGAASVVAFTSAAAFMRDRGCPLPLAFAAYVFFCVMPFVSAWALCMVKDSLFSLFYVPYFLMLFDVARTRGASLARPRAVVLFALLGLLLCLTKKQGIYVVIPTALIAALLYREHWHALVAQALLSAVVVLVLFPLAVFPLLNVEPGGKQEVLGTLFQQTARYVTYYPDDVTDDERAAIDAVLEYDNLPDQYTFNFQDEVKYRFRLDATTNDLTRYLGVWVAQGLRQPESYVASLMGVAGHYLAPCAIVNIRMVTVDTHMDGRYMLYNPEELDSMREGMAAAYNALANTPGPNIPFLLVTYTFWLPAALLYTTVRRQVPCGVLFAPTLVLVAFCVIAPVYDARYAVPLLYTAPLMVCSVAAFLRMRYHEHQSNALRETKEEL